MSSHTPPGWPEGVPPHGVPDWEKAATNWLLDLCPPDYRGYPALRKHALALAWLAGSPNMVFSTILFLATALGLGLGNGAVFKLVAQYFPKNTGLVTGIAGCAGGLGGFFPPLLLGFVKDATGSYALGFVLLFSAIALARRGRYKKT